MTHNPVKSIVSSLGEDELRQRLGVSKFAMKHAKANRMFPASWFDLLDRMCLENDIACPREAFNWKDEVIVPASSKRGNAAVSLQGAAPKEGAAS